jgi:7,8-dihydro-6-hydroxymethylpterin-pyrophosphokinase
MNELIDIEELSQSHAQLRQLHEELAELHEELAAQVEDLDTAVKQLPDHDDVERIASGYEYDDEPVKMQIDRDNDDHESEINSLKNEVSELLSALEKIEARLGAVEKQKY